MINLQKTVATKDEFIEIAKSRLAKEYSVWYEIATRLAALSVSFYFVFLKPLPVVIAIDGGIFGRVLIAGYFLLVLILCYFATQFAARFFIGGLTGAGLGFGSYPYYVKCRSAPLEFLSLGYLLISVIAIFMTFYEEPFVVNSEIRALTPLESFYFVAATVTTIGSGDIYPITEAGRIISLLLYGLTILIVVFVFERIAKDISVVKEVTAESLGRSYDEIEKALARRNVSEEEKSRALTNMANRYDFNNPDGIIRLDMCGTIEQYYVKVYTQPLSMESVLMFSVLAIPLFLFGTSAQYENNMPLIGSVVAVLSGLLLHVFAWIAYAAYANDQRCLKKDKNVAFLICLGGLLVSASAVGSLALRYFS